MANLDNLDKAPNAGAKLILARAQEDETRMALLLASPDGVKLVDYLKSLYYDCDLLGPDANAVYALLGKREVVRHLMDLQRKAKEK